MSVSSRQLQEAALVERGLLALKMQRQADVVARARQALREAGEDLRALVEQDALLAKLAPGDTPDVVFCARCSTYTRRAPRGDKWCCGECGSLRVKDAVAVLESPEAGRLRRWPAQARAVADEVCRVHDIEIERVLAPTRKREVVAARQEIMARLHLDLGMSLPTVGALLGRDHTTVMHAVKKARANGA